MTLLRANQNKDTGQLGVSPQSRLPTDDGTTSNVQSVSAETVQFYYYTAAGVLTIDSGQPAGTVVVFKLINTNVLDELGGGIGNFGDSSFVFGTGTALITAKRKPFRGLLAETAEGTGMTEPLSAQARAVAVTGGYISGEWCLDHERGFGYGKKATTATTDTASYKVFGTGTGGSVGITSAATSVARFQNTLPYGVYQSSPATLTNGQAAPLPLDASQNLKIALQNLAATSSTGTITAAGQIIGPFDVTSIRAWAFHLTGTYSFSWIAEHSGDGGTTWEALPVHQESLTTTVWQTASSGASNRLMNSQLTTGQVRLRASAYVSGTVTVSVLLFPSAAANNTQSVVGFIQGYVAEDAAASGANPMLVGGRASNAEPTAMSADADLVAAWRDRRGRAVIKRMDKYVRSTTATTTVVSSTTSALAKVIATAALAGTVTIYDNSAASGAVLQILPVGFIGTFEPDSLMVNGITIVTSAADQITAIFSN